MEPGDLILTPSWTWHDHGSEINEPVMWLDGLDIPIVQMLDAGFQESLSQDQQTQGRPVGDSIARYGANLVPVDYKPTTLTSPVFAYPYSRTREALECLSKGSPVDPCHGFKMRYINPVTGGHAMPTISTFMQLLPKGFAGSKLPQHRRHCFYRRRGPRPQQRRRARLRMGTPRIFVVPSWVEVRHEVTDNAVLFSYSDRVVQEQLGLWREKRG